MKAQLSDVLETKLVTDRSVEGKKFNEAILGDSQSILHLETATTDLRFPSKLIIHLFHNSVEQSLLLTPVN